MADYPRLMELGVANPQEIEYFSVNSIDYNDFLRIVYDRPKGSLLPLSRSYRFPRIQKTLNSNDSGAKDQVVMESSPVFREVLAELRNLMGTREHKKDIVAEVLDELRQLEEEFALRSEHLKTLIKTIGAS